MKKLSLAVLAISGAALVLPAPAQAQGLFGDLVRRAKQEAERKAREELQRRVTGTPSTSSGSPSSSPSSSSSGAPSGGFAGSRTGPSATTMIGTTAPQSFWVDDLLFWRAQGTYKFKRTGEDSPQVIANNPYLSPENPLFARFKGLSCAADGSVIVAADGWANGDYSGSGWWRVAPDGAIRPLVTHVFGENKGQPLSGKFSITANDTLLSSFKNAIWRVTPDGAYQRIAGMTDVEGYADGPGAVARFKELGQPIGDPQGNIWVADAGSPTNRGACALRRIDPNGNVTTVVDASRSICGSNPDVSQRITLSSIAWDDTKGEIVAAGSTIVARPAHDLHASIWRIRPDGTARRVYYTVKGGRSPIGQNMDHIWSVAVDPKGRISVISQTIPSFNVKRRILRLNEATGRLVPVTGQNSVPRYGFNEYMFDGSVGDANIRQAEDMCFAPNGTLFFTDYHLLRRVDNDATVRTWAY